jgi:hypothetical protein
LCQKPSALESATLAGIAKMMRYTQNTGPDRFLDEMDTGALQVQVQNIGAWGAGRHFEPLRPWTSDFREPEGHEVIEEGRVRNSTQNIETLFSTSKVY